MAALSRRCSLPLMLSHPTGPPTLPEQPFPSSKTSQNLSRYPKACFFPHHSHETEKADPPSYTATVHGGDRRAQHSGSPSHLWSTNNTISLFQNTQPSLFPPSRLSYLLHACESNEPRLLPTRNHSRKKKIKGKDTDSWQEQFAIS